MWIRIVHSSTTSNILITGNVAIKCAASLNGPGSLFSSIRLMIRCTGRNNKRKRPASAITNFFEMDEKITLFISEDGLGLKNINRYKYILFIFRVLIKIYVLKNGKQVR
jgi:hypothetical protein